MLKIRQIIFSAHSLSYEQILQIMSSIKNPNIEFKMVPSNLEVVIGKSHIEKLDDYPLLEIDYSLGRKFNRYLKRGTDLFISLLFLVLLSPFALLSIIFRLKNHDKHKIIGADDRSLTVFRSRNSEKSSLLEFYSLLYQVMRGNLSLVGAPIVDEDASPETSGYLYKPGLTGLVQINQDKITSQDDAEKFHLYYLKNQSTLLDLEILLKSIFKKWSGQGKGTTKIR